MSRVIKYDTRLSIDRLPTLIKENSFNYGKGYITNPQHVVDFLNNIEEAPYLDHEIVWLFCMNNKGKLIGYFKISEGTCNLSVLSPREIFIKALAVGSVSIILAHNHPSGDSTPSKEDISLTKRIKQCGELLGITLNDHIVLGENTYTSLREMDGIVW